ncbi:class I SAM-dependent methyltransferase [Tepidibacillus fermentans]|uniref:SAM-dependent MidA family methyltransferase n=1 Tax=Tepidibacillus fermentans TaxID=1281767 RepID=A0A4R3KKM2_9BACI|nr:SAM-dependent methyltransferase [Tepidibacillus fermentans]TCS84435.1 SAM-dependent MidA family methyltransferase [Tepidibacillus fermentans]
MKNSQNQLKDKIIQKIKNQKDQRITFYEFMKMALYEPDLGYYTKNRTKIGKAADFYTSSTVGPVFGKTIANTFLELLPYSTDKEDYTILEMGGGDGRFARDALTGIKEKNLHIYEKLIYYMIETSPYHQDLQRERLKEHLDHVKWVDRLEEIPQPFQGVIFSNELVDAFPVHLVQMKEGKLKEIYVTWDEEKGDFAQITDEISTKELETYFLEQKIILKEEQIAEVNLDAIQWLETIVKFLDKGYVITIDYGYPADELYASHRQNGTLMCYHRHVANENPYQKIGDQDITSHVNFTELINRGEKLGLKTILFTTQSYFLLNSGILEYLQEIELNQMLQRDLFHDEALKMNRAIRQLITPGEMGETFKVLVQQKNVSDHQFRFMTGIIEQYGLSM